MKKIRSIFLIVVGFLLINCTSDNDLANLKLSEWTIMQYNSTEDRLLSTEKYQISQNRIIKREQFFGGTDFPLTDEFLYNDKEQLHLMKRTGSGGTHFETHFSYNDNANVSETLTYYEDLPEIVEKSEYFYKDNEVEIIFYFSSDSGTTFNLIPNDSKVVLTIDNADNLLKTEWTSLLNYPHNNEDIYFSYDDRGNLSNLVYTELNSPFLKFERVYSYSNVGENPINRLNFETYGNKLNFLLYAGEHYRYRFDGNINNFSNDIFTSISLRKNDIEITSRDVQSMFGPSGLKRLTMTTFYTQSATNGEVEVHEFSYN